MNAQIPPDRAAELASDLLRTMKLLFRFRDREGRHTPGLDAKCQPILHRVAQCNGMRVSDLATSVHADVSTVSRYAADLVASGLLAKTTDPHDRRVQSLELTDEGRATLASLHEERAKTFSRILADWTPADLDAFHTYLDRFSNDLERDLAASTS